MSFSWSSGHPVLRGWKRQDLERVWVGLQSNISLCQKETSEKTTYFPVIAGLTNMQECLLLVSFILVVVFSVVVVIVVEPVCVGRKVTKISPHILPLFESNSGQQKRITFQM